jgi:glutathione S-transferase
MIKVYKFGPAFGMPDSSPFVVKVETYLRIIGEKYETATGDVRNAPRKQLPFVEIDGKVIPDSTQIVDHVEASRKEKLDAHLDPKQQAVAFAFKSMLEEHLYFGILVMRWATDEGWAVFEPSLREMMGKMGVPALMRGMVTKSARKHVVSRATTQGFGRLPRADVVATCKKMVDAVSVELGDREWFCGDKPSTYDATVYAFASGILCPAFDNELRKHAVTKKNLVAYADRIQQKYWKD